MFHNSNNKPSLTKRPNKLQHNRINGHKAPFTGIRYRHAAREWEVVHRDVNFGSRKQLEDAYKLLENLLNLDDNHE